MWTANRKPALVECVLHRAVLHVWSLIALSTKLNVDAYNTSFLRLRFWNSQRPCRYQEGVPAVCFQSHACVQQCASLLSPYWLPSPTFISLESFLSFSCYFSVKFIALHLFDHRSSQPWQNNVMSKSTNFGANLRGFKLQQHCLLALQLEGNCLIAQFPHNVWGDDNHIYLTGLLWRPSELTFIKIYEDLWIVRGKQCTRMLVREVTSVICCVSDALQHTT